MSTDAPDPESDHLDELPPAYQQAIRAEVRDVLRQSGKGIATEKGLTRRQVISAGGYVALGALLGGGGLFAAVNPVQAAPVGEVGTPSEPIDKIYADEIGTSSNPITSIATAKTNSIVYASEYSTFSNAISDVPNGGTLYLPAQEYDVANYGRLVVNGGNGINIVGERGDGNDGYGARIINTGGDAVSSGPIVEIDGVSGTDRRNMRVEGLYVKNEAAVAGYKFTDSPALVARDLKYDSVDAGQADTAFETSGEMSTSRFYTLDGTSEEGSVFEIGHTGGDVCFFGCGGSVRGSATVADIAGQSIWFGGAFQNGTTGVVITAANVVMHRPWFESLGTAVQFGDSAAPTQADFPRVIAPYMASITTSLADFQDSNQAVLDLQGGRTVGGSTNGYNFDANASHPTIIHSQTSAARTHTGLSNAENPNIVWDFVVDSDSIRNARTAAAGTFIFNQGSSVPEYYDGTNWRIFSDDTTT